MVTRHFYIYYPESGRGTRFTCNGVSECTRIMYAIALDFTSDGGFCVKERDDKSETVMYCENSDGEKVIIGFVRLYV